MLNNMGKFYSGGAKKVVVLCIMCEVSAIAVYSSYILYTWSSLLTLAVAISVIAYSASVSTWANRPKPRTLLASMLINAVLLLALLVARWR